MLLAIPVRAAFRSLLHVDDLPRALFSPNIGTSGGLPRLSCVFTHKHFCPQSILHCTVIRSMHDAVVVSLSVPGPRALRSLV